MRWDYYEFTASCETNWINNDIASDIAASCKYNITDIKVYSCKDKFTVYLIMIICRYYGCIYSADVENWRVDKNQPKQYYIYCNIVLAKNIINVITYNNRPSM